MFRFIFFLVYGFCFSLNFAYSCQLIDQEKDFWPPQIVRWQGKDHQELIFVAVHHTNDLHSPIHQVIKKIFEEEKPDVFVMEGFCSQREGMSPIRLKEKSIQIYQSGKCNENLYGAYLATKFNIPFIGPELPEEEQIPLLKEQGYTVEDTVFYMLVMQLPYFYRDGDFETHTQAFTPHTWKQMCEQYMQKNIAEWLKTPVHLTFEDFLRWWEHHFCQPLNMENEFKDWERGCMYMEPSNHQNACITQRISYFFHKNRDDYIFKRIQEITHTYKKVLVVYGSNHLRDQWDQLIQVYGKPILRQEL